MSGPWEEFQRPAPTKGPWTEFRAPTAADRAREDGRRRAAKNPTASALVGQGVMFSFGDELAGVVGGAERGAKNALLRLQGKEVPYTAAQARQGFTEARRESDAAFAQRRPITNTLLQAGGGILSGGLAGGGRAVVGRTLAGTMARSAGAGAGYGAISGAGAAEGGLRNRTTGAAKGAVFGAIVGAATPVGARVAQQAGRALTRGRVQPPDVEALRASRTAAYDAVDASGARYSPDAYNSLVDNIVADAEKANLNPMRHPRAASMIEDLKRLKDEERSLTELDQLRQVVQRDVAGATDGAEAFFGRRIKGQIDAFVDQADETQMVAGDAVDAAQRIRSARDLNTRVRKVEAVQDAVESARLRAGSTGTGGNVDNATRQNLRRVLEDTPNLKPAERRALESAVVGSRGQNALRQVGRLSPGGNGLMQALYVGGAMANPMVGVPALTGIVAKHVADSRTQQKVTYLLRLMAEGGDEAAEREIMSMSARDPRVARVLSDVARAARIAAPTETGRVAGQPTYERAPAP